MTTEFNKGIEYEKLRRDMVHHLWLGWGSLIFFVLLLFAPDEGLIASAGLMSLMFSILALNLGYSERKQLKEMKK